MNECYSGPIKGSAVETREVSTSSQVGHIGLQWPESTMDQRGTGALVCLTKPTVSGLPVRTIVRRYLDLDLG
jgi:hypothetical protein